MKSIVTQLQNWLVITVWRSRPTVLITFKDLVPKYLIPRKQHNVTLQGSYLETHTL